MDFKIVQVPQPFFEPVNLIRIGDAVLDTGHVDEGRLPGRPELRSGDEQVLAVSLKPGAAGRAGGYCYYYFFFFGAEAGPLPMVTRTALSSSSTLWVNSLPSGVLPFMTYSPGSPVPRSAGGLHLPVVRVPRQRPSRRRST